MYPVKNDPARDECPMTIGQLLWAILPAKLTKQILQICVNKTETGFIYW